ncbi:hypothetical protein H1230_30005 [Paenibacillus sp. 19GGS1-52]|uniref:hypothetical protein n=1 Tax=Paenibacillus sp. 19GGS1-52 TaxID=2758563 RepID=UPI001EFB088B|nr:hypothetical protein [Paenibacillus sp. 19GGS1-52]ULO07124.1 hypothetical protein H1230_30005 [Paenibacillus sp. 19GGS1-52]
MWIFDRSRTTYAESAGKFIKAISYRYSDEVFKAISSLFKVTLESAKNTYATPISHLGVAYKVEVDKYRFGKTEVSPAWVNTSNVEYRYTEPALLLLSGRINMETFMLINIIRFQVLNSTLEKPRFDERIDNKVLPLLLTIQTLKQLEKIDQQQAYISEMEIGLLYQKPDHTDIFDFAKKIIESRETPHLSLPPGKNPDAFFNLFHSTGVIISCKQVWINGQRKGILVLAANRKSIVDKLLLDPPEFLPITWNDRWKWAYAYSKLPGNYNNYLPSEKQPVLIRQLPSNSKYDSTTGTLLLFSIYGAQFKINDLVVWSNPVSGLKENVIYKINGYPSFLQDGTVAFKIVEEFRSSHGKISY